MEKNSNRKLSVDKKEFIKILKELRELSEWTIKELAEKTEISSGYLSDLECGIAPRTKGISPEYFSKLVSIYKNSPHFTRERRYRLYYYYLKLSISSETFGMIKEFEQFER